METVDQGQQWRELKETYDRMTEGELCRVADEAFDLTPVAREALQAVISERGLNIPLATAPLPLEPAGETGDPDNPDDALISVRKLWSETEAKQAKAILEANFIASCLGPENIVDLEDFKASFDGGVDLKVFSGDSRRALGILALYAPQEGEEDWGGDGKEYAVLCPKCHSPEVSLRDEGPETEATVTDAQFNWICDSCGHHWKDDGIAQIV